MEEKGEGEAGRVWGSMKVVVPKEGWAEGGGRLTACHPILFQQLRERKGERRPTELQGPFSLSFSLSLFLCSGPLTPQAAAAAAAAGTIAVVVGAPL